MVATVGFQWNMKSNVQQLTLYKVVYSWLLLNSLDVEPVINCALINAAKDLCDGLILKHLVGQYLQLKYIIISGLVGNFQCKYL